MKLYNKLIRDRIPEIIEASGQSYEVKVLDDDAYERLLDQKLSEELQEYQQSSELAELVDLMEVIYAIAKYKGVSLEELEALRLAKQEERGGFDRRLLLVSVGE